MTAVVFASVAVPTAGVSQEVCTQAGRVVCQQETYSLWVRQVQVFDAALTEQQVATLHDSVTDGIDNQCLTDLIDSNNVNRTITHPYSINWNDEEPTITTTHCSCPLQINAVTGAQSNCFGPHGRYSVVLSPSVMVMVTKNVGSEPLTFQTSGRFSGNVQVAPVTLKLRSGAVKGFVTSFCAVGAGPTVSHLIVVDDFDSYGASHATAGGGAVTGIAPGAVFAYMLYASEEGHCHSRAQHLAMFHAVVQSLRPCLRHSVDVSVSTVESDDLTNVALGGKANQSSLRQGGIASRAVDGDRNATWGHGSCTHTQNGPAEEWWQVDLGQPYAISELRLFHRTDCCQDRLVSAVVAISDTADYEAGTPCHTASDHFSQPEIGNCRGLTGQFLTVSLHNEFLTICEFEATGQPVGNRDADQCAACPPSTTSEAGAGSCSLIGCTDQWSATFSPSAMIDDGSCEYSCAEIPLHSGVAYDRCVVDMNQITGEVDVPEGQSWMLQGRKLPEMQGLFAIEHRFQLGQNANLTARHIRFQFADDDAVVPVSGD